MRYNDINWNDASASVSPVTDTDGNVVGGHVEFTGITQPHPGQPYKYDLTDSNLDRRITTGQGSGTSLAFDVDKKYVGESLTLTYSFGWTRYEPRMVRAMYSADAFIPDIDQGDGEFTEPSVIDPANVKDYCHEDDDPPPDECPHDCFGTGQWIRRGPSTTYLIADDLDRMTDGGEAFVAGDLVRYMGGNWSDPGIDPQTLTEDHDLTIGYWRNFTEMKRTPVQQRIIDRAKKGVVTQGGKWFLTDSSQDWHGYPFGGGDGRVISGTTTAGGSTSITDSTIADEENEERCYFDAGRFVGYSAAYAGFTLEVDPIDDGTSSSSADGEAPPPVVKFPILSANQSGVITIPSYCGASFVAGQSYRIREPKWNLNRWQGRKLIITQPDGTKLTTTVAGNDRDTLFFAPLSVDIEEGATFEIVEFKIGGVYKRTSSGWIEPSGSDPRGQDFHKDVHENAPTIIKRYGRARQHDHWTLVYEQELFKTIDSLRWTVRDFGWTGRADPDVPEVNLFSIEGQNYLGNQCWSNIDDLHTMLDNYWLAPRAGSPDEGYTIGVIAAIRESYSMTCPHCDEFTKEESGWWFSYGGPPAAHWNWANADAADSGYVVGFNVTRGYAYPTLGGMCKFISRSIDFLIYTTAFCSPNPSPFYPAIDNRWASFGDPVVEDSFGLVTSMTTTAESVIGPKVGDTTPEIPRPNDLMYPQYSQICDYETGGDYHTSIGAYYTGGCRGYQIISSKAVLKWSFDYVT